MRKTLSIVLSLIMVLSLGIVAVHADDAPTPIATAEAFIGIEDATGSYKLTADIELTESYAKDFTGKLDGDGHIIKINGKAVFKQLKAGAEISNLTITGFADTANNTKGYIGALADYGQGITVTNVTNKANVTTKVAKGYAGGLIGQMTTGGGTHDAHQKSYFNKCVNEGTITDTENEANRLGGIVGNAAKYQYCVYTECVNNGEIVSIANGKGAYVGGIAGATFGGEAHKCINNGNISSPNGTGWCGGIIARLTPSAQGTDQSVLIKDCVNNGAITIETGDYVSGGYAGGITGGTGTAPFTATDGKDKNTYPNGGPTCAVYTMDGCVNNGKVVSGGQYAAGIIGYVWGQNKADDSATVYQYAVVKNCINKGDIEGKKNIDPMALWNAQEEGKKTQNPGENPHTYVSQFLAYSNADCTTITDNIGAGKLTNVNDDFKVFFGLSGATATNYNASGNKIVEGTKNFSYACDAYKSNKIDNKTYYENVLTTDSDTGAVTGDRTSNRIPLTADLADKVQVLTAAEMDALLNPSQGGSTPTTGDASVWFVIVGIVSVLGMAVAVKTVKSN